MAVRETRREKKFSLAKGPISVVGLVMIAYGMLALIFANSDFNVSGEAVSGERFLGLQVNGWTDLIFIGLGAVLVFGAQTHRGAKTAAIGVGITLLVLTVLGLIWDEDLFDVFATNGWTLTAWGVLGGLLLALALLPRREEEERERLERRPAGATAERRVAEPTERRPLGYADTERVNERDERFVRGERDREVVAPAEGNGAEERRRTRR